MGRGASISQLPMRRGVLASLCPLSFDCGGQRFSASRSPALSLSASPPYCARRLKCPSTNRPLLVCGCTQTSPGSPAWLPAARSMTVGLLSYRSVAREPGAPPEGFRHEVQRAGANASRLNALAPVRDGRVHDPNSLDRLILGQPDRPGHPGHPSLKWFHSFIPGRGGRCLASVRPR